VVKRVERRGPRRRSAAISLPRRSVHERRYSDEAKLSRSADNAAYLQTWPCKASSRLMCVSTHTYACTRTHAHCHRHRPGAPTRTNEGNAFSQDTPLSFSFFDRILIHFRNTFCPESQKKRPGADSQKSRPFQRSKERKEKNRSRRSRG